MKRGIRLAAVFVFSVVGFSLADARTRSNYKSQHQSEKSKSDQKADHNHDNHLDGVNRRGDAVMGFSHAKTAHHFLLKPDGGVIQVEIFDNRAPDATSDSAERWFYQITDDFEGWQHVSIPFAEFQRRSDWQPGGAPDDGLGLTEVHGYAFGMPAGVGAHTVYLAQVELTSAN